MFYDNVKPTGRMSRRKASRLAYCGRTWPFRNVVFEGGDVRRNLLMQWRKRGLKSMNHDVVLLVQEGKTFVSKMRGKGVV